MAPRGTGSRTPSVRPSTPPPPPPLPQLQSQPSSPDHLITALPPPPSRSPTRSPSRHRTKSTSPEKQQSVREFGGAVVTTANQVNPRKFVTSTVFTPSKSSGSGAGARAGTGGGVRLGTGETIIGGGAGGEEAWRIRVVVEAEREGPGGMKAEAAPGGDVGRGVGRGRGRGRGRGGSATPRVRKATPAGRGGGRGRSVGGEDEDGGEDRVVVRKKRSTAPLAATDALKAQSSRGRGRARTVTARTPVQRGAGEADSDEDEDDHSDDDSDGGYPFLDISREEERSQSGSVVSGGSNGKGKAVQTTSSATPRAKRVATPATIAKEATASKSPDKPKAPRASKETSATTTTDEGDAIKRPREPGQKDHAEASVGDLNDDEDREDEDGDAASVVIVPKTRARGNSDAAAGVGVGVGAGIGIGKRITATSTMLGIGRLRTSTTASDAIREKRRLAKEREQRNVTPRERVGSVVSLDSPIASAAPLLIPKTRQSASSASGTAPPPGPTTRLRPTRQRVVSNTSLQSQQTATPPPTSSPGPLRSPLGEMRGSRVNSVSMSPGREEEGKFEEESAIDWTGFAVGGESDSDGDGGGSDAGVGGSASGSESGSGEFTEHIGPLEKTSVAAAQATPSAAGWQLPTPSATQSQQTRISETAINLNWPASTPTKHPSTTTQQQPQHQRNPSVASSTAWPDTDDAEPPHSSAEEDEDETIVHKRISSIDSAAYFSESQSQPGSVRRSSVITATPGGTMVGGKGGKERKRIMDILPGDYESRRTLFDGVVPPRAESPPVVIKEEAREDVRPKRKGKRKNVGFAGEVEEIPAVASRSLSPLAQQQGEDEIEQFQQYSENSRFPSSPPAPLPHQQLQQQQGEMGPHTPTQAHNSAISFLPDLFVPKRRYIEVARQKVQSRRAPELARCRVASVVFQRAVLGDMGGRDGGGVPREFGGYLVRVDEGGKGKERALESEFVDAEVEDGGVGVLVRRGIAVPQVNSPIPGPSWASVGVARCESPTGEVSYPIAPARRISRLGFAPGAAPTSAPIALASNSNDGASIGNSTPTGSSGFRETATAMSTPSRYGGSGAGTNATNTPSRGNLSNAQAAVVIKDTISNARAFSGATGRGPGGSASVVQTPMKEKDLRASLLETLARSRRMLGIRRSVTPPERGVSELGQVKAMVRAGDGVMMQEAREKLLGKEKEEMAEERTIEEDLLEENMVDEEVEPEVDIDGLIQEQLMKQVYERRSAEIEEQQRPQSQEPKVLHQNSPAEARPPSASVSPKTSPSPQPASSPAPVTPTPPPATPAARAARRQTRTAITPSTARVTRSMSARSSVEVEETDMATSTPAPTRTTRLRSARASTIPIDESPVPVLIPPSTPIDTPAPSRRPARGLMTRQRLTLEERWEEERRENVRRAREGTVVVVDEDEVVVQKETVVVEDEDEEVEEDEGYVLGTNEERSEEEESSGEEEELEGEEVDEEEAEEEEEEEMVDVIEDLRPTTAPKYLHANNPVVEEYMEVEQQQDYIAEEEATAKSDDETDSAEDDEPPVFPRRGIIRKPGASPARGINMTPFTPIRKPPARVPAFGGARSSTGASKLQYNHASEQEEGESTATATTSSETETEDSSKEEPIVYPRRGILRKSGASPAMGINMSPSTPIRYAPRESRWGIEGQTPPQVILGRAYLAKGQPAWTPRDLRLGEWQGEEEESSAGWVEGGDEDEDEDEDEEGEDEEGEDEAEEDEEEDEEEEGGVEGEEQEEAEEVDGGSEMDTEGNITPVPPPSKPGIAARLFGSWWNSNKSTDSLKEILPSELSEPNPHAHPGYDHSHSQNWAITASSPSNSRGDQTSYADTSMYIQQAANVQRHSQHPPQKHLTRPDLWLPRHWTLLDQLMYSLPHPNAAVTPPRAPARYDMFKRNRLREVSRRNSSTTRSLRIPFININIPLPRPALPERNWRKHPIMELDEREKMAVGWFVHEARVQFGEDWSGKEREEGVEKMVRCWGLGRVKIQRGDEGLRVSGVGKEERRREYYRGIRL